MMNSTTNDDLLSRKKESSTAERDALREALTRDQTQHPQQQRDRQQDQQDRHEMKSPASDATKKKNKKKKKKKKAGTVVDFCDTIGRRTFRVSQSDSAGRCILAARDLGAGELIIDEPPFAKVVRRDCALRHCATCCRQINKPGRIEADNAPYAAYCSRVCKAKEEALRSAEAGALGKLAAISAERDVDLDLLRMVLRLLISRAEALGFRSEAEGGMSREVGEDSGDAGRERSHPAQQWRNLHSLMHHRETMPPEWIKVIRAAAEDMMLIIPEWAHFELDEVVELACRVNVNAHGLRDDSGSNLVIGLGMFPLTAMINHSCRPNCTFAFHGGKIHVRTLEAVAAGTELSLYYIDLLQSKAKRRQELLASKHFLCTCSRCENPDLTDSYLDGVCCVDCGKDGCLTVDPPPSPEDILAAQLAELGEDLGLSGSTSSGLGKSNKKGKVKAPSPANGKGRTPVDKASKKTASSESPEALHNQRGGDTGDDSMYCSSCGRQYPRVSVSEGVARAEAAWDAAMAVLRTKNFPSARKSLERWLEDYDAGSVTTLATQSKKTPSKKKNRVKLHPANALVVQTLVPLANCCNFEEDFAASARHLRRARSAMEAVYPPNYPELGDFYAALADAITSLLDKPGQTLPKKFTSHAASERKQALERAATIRSICLGQEHPTTREAMKALDRA